MAGIKHNNKMSDQVFEIAATVPEPIPTSNKD
jgi:hypothetical protein